MECNHEQPKQFINHNYLQVEGGNHGACQQVSNLITSIADDTIPRMSAAAWITLAYLRPKIMYCLECIWYSTHLASYSIMNSILFLGVVTGMSSIICFILLLSHIISIEMLVSDNDESFLLLAGNSTFYAAVWFAIVILLLMKPPDSVHVKSFLSYCIATLIVGNVVYICCYLPPFMLLALFHNPLVALSTYFIILLVIIVTFCFCFLMTAMNQIPLWANHTFMIECLFVMILFTFIFAAILMTVKFLFLLYGSVSDSHLLQAVLLSLSLSLTSLKLLKPVYSKVLKHRNLIYI